jgi:hypothetical protein
MKDTLSRRELLNNAATLSALAVFGATACGKSTPAALSCTDTSALTPSERSVRMTLGYADVSTEAGKSCLTCQQYIAAPAAGACGTCKVLKGPINPAGYCKSFAAKVT